MTGLTTEQIAAIKVLEAAASPGDWYADVHQVNDDGGHLGWFYAQSNEEKASKAIANVNFIAAIRNSARALLDAAAREAATAAERDATAEHKNRILRDLACLTCGFLGQKFDSKCVACELAAARAENERLCKAMERIKRMESEVLGLKPELYGHAKAIAARVLAEVRGAKP